MRHSLIIGQFALDILHIIFLVKKLFPFYYIACGNIFIIIYSCTLVTDNQNIGIGITFTDIKAIFFSVLEFFVFVIDEFYKVFIHDSYFFAIRATSAAYSLRSHSGSIISTLEP